MDMQMNDSVIVRARAPLRISFGGGGTDVSPYCDERGGAVLSATINRYAYATIGPGEGRFDVRSLDYDAAISYALDDPVVFDGQLDLAKGVLERFRGEAGLAEGVAIDLHNDAPPGSGLGSSSAITVAIITALRERLRMPADDYATAELAYAVEREDVGIKGGRQDHYAAAFGGFNFIEFERGAALVNPLRLRPETIYELEYSLVFAYVGGTHFSSHIIEKQVANYESGSAVAAMDRNKELAYAMKRALLLGKLSEFGALLDEAWAAKKQMAEGISTPRIDEIYERARAAGALGGKVTGAGGGGFMFFLCEPRRRFQVQESLRELGAEVVNFSFVHEGARAWRP